MDVIAVINQKGGAGKTTLTLCLAVAAHLEGLSVVVVDLDPQSLADDWGRDRREGMPVVVSCELSRLRPVLEAAEQSGVQFVLIDTAPRAEEDALEAAKVSDLVLVPCRCTSLDVRATEGTLESLDSLSKEDRPVVWSVLNGTQVDSPDHRKTVEALGRMGLSVAPHVLGQRHAFHRAYELGLSPQEIDATSRASSEIKALFEFVRQQLVERGG